METIPELSLFEEKSIIPVTITIHGVAIYHAKREHVQSILEIQKYIPYMYIEWTDKYRIDSKSFNEFDDRRLYDYMHRDRSDDSKMTIYLSSCQLHKDDTHGTIRMGDNDFLTIRELNNITPKNIVFMLDFYCCFLEDRSRVWLRIKCDKYVAKKIYFIDRVVPRIISVCNSFNGKTCAPRRRICKKCRICKNCRYGLSWRDFFSHRTFCECAVIDEFIDFLIPTKNKFIERLNELCKYSYIRFVVL